MIFGPPNRRPPNDRLETSPRWLSTRIERRRVKVGDRGSGVRRCERAMILLYVATAALIPLQRGVWGPQSNAFKIFRRSFWHLVQGRNLYAAYPGEQGAGAADLFKYSPTGALLLAPLGPPSYAVALLAWSLLGAGLLWYALTRVLPRERAVLAAALLYPDMLASLQACSSNAA